MPTVKQAIKLNGSQIGSGWEKCSLSFSNKEVWGIPLEFDSDAPAHCIYCNGNYKEVIGRLGGLQYLRCRDCGIITYRTIRNGIAMISTEEVSE